MEYILVTAGEHTGTLMAHILGRFRVVYSRTLPRFSALSDISDEIRKEMKYVAFDM